MSADGKIHFSHEKQNYIVRKVKLSITTGTLLSVIFCTRVKMRRFTHVAQCTCFKNHTFLAGVAKKFVFLKARSFLVSLIKKKVRKISNKSDR